MKALVLGGNGFIGSHLVDQLLRDGYSVRVYDRGPEKFRSPIAEVEYRLADFSAITALSEALEGVDVVFHLISTTVPSTSNLDPVGDIQSNLINTVQLLQLMVQQRVGRIVYLSSGGTVYGIPDKVPISENHPLRPICSYGVVKVAIENYLLMYHQLHGLDYVVLRASNPYGERQGHMGVQGVIGTFIAKVSMVEPIEIWGDGNIIRDFIYVDDLAKLCIIAGKSNEIGSYNAGSGVGYSITEIVQALMEVTGRIIEPIYRTARGYDVPCVILDTSKAKRTYNWKPEIDLIQGLTRLWSWTNKVQ